MSQVREADDSSQEARVSEVRKLVDDVLEKLHMDREASLDPELAGDSDDGTVSPRPGDDLDENGKRMTVKKRKSTRSTRWKGGKHRVFGQKGRNRRMIFKKHVYKSPASCAVPVTTDFIVHRGVYFQVGDIVSLIDDEDGDKYYAQIRGFLTDEYCEHFAAIHWLIPTIEAPDDGSFDASFYFLGPEEDMPRPMDCMQFEQHSPSDYFCHKDPLTVASSSRSSGWMWTTLSPRIVKR